MIKLLLIENDEELAASLRQSLVKENYDVTCITDVEEGMLHALSDYYNIIILEITLPKKMDLISFVNCALQELMFRF